MSVLNTRTFFLRGILVFISIALTLFLLEGTLRFLQSYFSEKTENEERSTEKVEQQLGGLMKQQHIEENTYNIYYFGESTMKGEPFIDTLPRLLSTMFYDTINGKPIRWINLGEYGISMGYSTDLIQWIIEHKDTYHPSLLIVYSGHNEFLQFQPGWGFEISITHTEAIDWIISHSRLANLIARLLHLYKLEINDRSFFDTPSFSQTQHDDTLRVYEKNIDNTALLAQRNKIPIIFSTVVGNYTDFEPNRSVCEASVDIKQQFQSLMHQGVQYFTQKQYDQAIQAYKRALTLCPEFAETYYQLGKAYNAIGGYEAAWDAYQEAIDTDRMPIRATIQQNDYIRQQATKSGVFVADAVRYVRDHTEHGLIGYNVMSDGHHPNLEGYLLIAESIAQTMCSIYSSATTSLQLITYPTASKMFMPDTESTYNMYYGRADWLLRLATWTYDPTMRVQKAQEYLHKAIILDPKRFDAYALYATLLYLQKDAQQANGYVWEAMRRNFSGTVRFFQQPWVVQIVIRALLT